LDRVVLLVVSPQPLTATDTRGARSPTCSLTAGGTKTTTFGNRTPKYLRVQCLVRATTGGMAFSRFSAYGATD
jgi:hypothetical protein